MELTQLTLKLVMGLALTVGPTLGLMAKPSKDESVLFGPYGLRIEAAPGCEKGAQYVLKKMKTTYLPQAVRFYGDPFAGKKPYRVFTLKVKRNDGSDGRNYTGPSWGSCSDGIDSFTIGLAKGSDSWEFDLTLVASKILTVCQEDNDASMGLYVNTFVNGKVKGFNAVKQLKEDIERGLSKECGSNGRDGVLRELAPKWAVFEELRKKHPKFILDYHTLKNKRFIEGKLSERISFSDMTKLLEEVTGENVEEMFKQQGVRTADGGASNGKSVVEYLRECDFLLNKDFKKNAKYYLCLFSASWCGPCRREMPRIAKTYAEQLKADPDIELIHFSRDQNDEKALAWAKEHDVKFPVVKPNGGNPLDLHSRGIPHLFIVKSDGTLVKEGHPMKLFTDENLRLLKAGTFVKPETTAEKENPAKPETATEKTRKAIAKLFPGWSLDTEVFDHDFAGIQANHRGLSNVTFVHPRNGDVPAIVSRTVTLSDQNPCLFLKLSSHNEEADFLLSVRVNGQTALPTRLICTPDFEPWQDLVVPLSDWRGKTVKVELVFNCNGWWYEFANLARLEIADSKGDMRITEGTETVNGYTWSYRAQNGEATIIAEKDGKFSRAVSPCPIGQLTIPATLGGVKVTRIGREAFVDCSAITAVTIPDGVTRIGRRAFQDCTGLRSVKIPSSVKTLEWDAFGGCRGMTSVTLPEGLRNIDRGAFYHCFALSSVMIPASVTHIGRDAFLSCSSLTSVTLPSSVTDIKWYAFRGCNALTSMTIPTSVTNIDKTAFCDTGALTSFRVEEGNQFYKSENGLLLTKDGKTLIRGVNGDVKIPSSVTNIGPCAFEGSVSLRPIVIPNGVKSIGDYAFKQCRSMTSVTIPEGVTDIGREAFSACKGLKSIEIPQGVTVVRNSTFTGTSLTNVTIQAGVKTLERGAFSWCGELKSVTFPEDLTSIGRDAFYNCGKLESLTIPSSVQRIEQGAFHGCGSLASLTIPSTVANIDRTAFDRCSKLKSVNVVTDGKIETLTFGEFQKKWKMAGLLGRNQQPQNADEHEKQRKNLLKIQDELKRAREAKTAAEAKGSDSAQKAISVAQKLQTCDFLLNKDFKKNAKYYLCLFSASWCGPCRAEMPRIAKTYAEQLKSDPNIELIHFSRDQNDEKALAWAKEHNVKFPVVKPNGGNPLELHCNGIPHLFILKADGTLVEEGHPAGLFNEEKLRLLVGKTGQVKANGYTWSYTLCKDEVTIASPTGKLYEKAISPNPAGGLVIPASIAGSTVTRLGKFALCKSPDLTSVKIPATVTSIGDWALSDCDKLDSVNIPSSVVRIGNCVFSSCPRLLKIDVDARNPAYKAINGVVYAKDLKRLVTCAGGVETVTIPAGVEEISDHAFRCCRKLKTITIPTSVRRIGENALGATALESVVIPSGVKDIDNAAFWCCGRLESVTIHEGLEDIGGRAFYQNWRLKSIRIPASVKKLGYGSFEDCRELCDVTMCGERPESSNNVFNKCDKLTEIHVPANAKSWAGMKEWQGKKLVFDAK